MEGDRTLVGVISDTHGLLRAAAVRELEGCDLIIHAGDIGAPVVLEELGRLAPVTAVRGNCDGDWARALPTRETLALGDCLLHVLHDLAQLDLRPEAAGVSVVISGHTHRPRVDLRGGVLYLNPGAAGPRRFELPICVARLTLGGEGGPEAEIVELAAR